MKLTDKEVEIVISLINNFQDDGASWEVDGVSLNGLKKKLINES